MPVTEAGGTVDAELAGHEMVGRDHHIAPAGELVEERFFGRSEKSGLLLFSLGVGAVERDHGRRAALEADGDGEISVRLLVGFDVIAHELPEVSAVDVHGFMDDEVEGRFGGLLGVPDELEVAAPQDLFPRLPVVERLDPRQQVVPGTPDRLRLGPRADGLFLRRGGSQQAAFGRRERNATLY